MPKNTDKFGIKFWIYFMDNGIAYPEKYKSKILT